MKSIFSPSKHERFLRDIEALVVGKTVMVERRDADWVFLFDPDFVITVGTLWRLIGTSFVCITSEDDGHQFGLPAPLDAETKANGLLSGKLVKSIDADIRTGDLSICLEGPLTLELVTTSSGYESWQMYQRGEFFAFGSSGGGWDK